MSAVDESLIRLPRHWAEVAILRQTLFHHNAVDVQILHYAGTLVTLAVEEVSCEHAASFDILLNLLQSHVLHEPARLHAVDVNDAVVVLLEEVQHLWAVLAVVLKALLQNGAVAAEVAILERFSALVNFRKRNVQIEHVRRSHFPLGHHDSLEARLWEIFQDPAFFAAILSFEALGQEMDQSQVFDMATLGLHHLTHLLGKA